MYRDLSGALGSWSGCTGVGLECRCGVAVPWLQVLLIFVKRKFWFTLALLALDFGDEDFDFDFLCGLLPAFLETFVESDNEEEEGGMPGLLDPAPSETN